MIQSLSSLLVKGEGDIFTLPNLCFTFRQKMRGSLLFLNCLELKITKRKAQVAYLEVVYLQVAYLRVAYSGVAYSASLH